MSCPSDARRRVPSHSVHIAAYIRQSRDASAAFILGLLSLNLPQFPWSLDVLKVLIELASVNFDVVLVAY